MRERIWSPTSGDPRAEMRYAGLKGIEPRIDVARETGVEDETPAKRYVAALRWMLQKKALGHDMFLLADPGPRARGLALQFCDLLGRECERVRRRRRRR